MIESLAVSESCESAQLEPVRICPVCDAQERRDLFTARDGLWDSSGEFNLVECNECGLIYLSERPSRESIKSYYPNDSYYSYKAPASYSLFRRDDAFASIWYTIKKSILSHGYDYKHLGGNNLVSVLSCLPLFRPIHDRATFQLGVLLHPYVDGGSLLEIGCGSGMYLGLMKALGWKRVVGVDIGSKAIEQARQTLGIEAYCGDLRDMEFNANSFDAASLSHTLEHVPDPTEFLSELGRVMKPGGRLAIIVPNVESHSSVVYGKDWFHLDTPRHMVNFTRRSLSIAIERASFRVESLETTPRMAYQTALFSYGRRAGDDQSAYTDAGHRYPIHRRARALLLSLIERMRCAAGAPAGEELVAVAIKPR